MGNSKRMLNWTMKIVKSFNGESFTSHHVTDRWGEYASVKYKPNTLAVSALLRKLEGRGLIRKTGDRTRYSSISGSTEKALQYKEV